MQFYAWGLILAPWVVNTCSDDRFRGGTADFPLSRELQTIKQLRAGGGRAPDGPQLGFILEAAEQLAEQQLHERLGRLRRAVLVPDGCTHHSAESWGTYSPPASS